MSDPILLLFAVVNVVVTALFAGVVLRQYVRRHRAHQLYWAIGLGMAFLATLAYICMVIVQPASSTGSLLFRVYYILGAALTSTWLGLGSLALIASPRVTRICLAIVCVLSVLAAVLIATAGIDTHALSHVAGTSGKGVLKSGPWVVTIIILNTLGVVAVAGVAIYSGWKLIRRQSTIGSFQASNVLWANVLILTGELLNALAGFLAGILRVDSTFWLFMALGWIVFFGGVLLAGHRTAAPRQVGASERQDEARRQLASS
ncbi:MAG: hypothetical protein H0W02_20770 [Ktedonobacteraceae bacterium]|nr:hypothetical protein [Ktedonobacteraceae bacterium]